MLSSSGRSDKYIHYNEFHMFPLQTFYFLDRRSNISTTMIPRYVFQLSIPKMSERHVKFFKSRITGQDRRKDY